MKKGQAVRRSKKDLLLDVAKRMPPLYHKRPGGEFDYRTSDVVTWLCGQPEILDYIFQSVANRSEAGKLIEYDHETGRWKGVEYGD